MRAFVVRLLVVGPLVVWVLSLAAVIVWGRWDAATRVDAIVVLGAAQYAGATVTGAQSASGPRGSPVGTGLRPLVCGDGWYGAR